MAKHNSRLNNVRYKHPLPIHPVETTLPIPDLIPHNPFSWIYCFYKYYRLVYNNNEDNLLETKINIDIIGGGNFPHIMVRDKKDMLYLWENGFFGTGTLSRSEPTWYNRMNKMVNGDITLNTGDLSELEQVTRRRRLERLEFKKLREKLQTELLELKKQSTVSSKDIDDNGQLDDTESLQKINDLLLKQREQLRDFKALQESYSNQNLDAYEDVTSNLQFDYESLFDENGDLLSLESLELMPVEATFLTFALPVLNITPRELFDKILSINGNNSYETIHNFIIHYVVYHFYRSHGWCVRSGIKFGCDYLLYKRGPPFHHAEFCINVMDNDPSYYKNNKNVNDYTWYSRISRVISGAKKTLLFSYVTRQTKKEQIMEWWVKGQFHKVFNSYQISEIIYKRWVPGRNRD